MEGYSQTGWPNGWNKLQSLTQKISYIDIYVVPHTETFIKITLLYHVNIYSSAQKEESVGSSETNIYQTTQRHILEDTNLHIYCEDLKCRNFFKKLRYRNYLNVIFPSRWVFKEIHTGNSSLGVFRFQQVFHFVKRHPWRRRVPRGLSRGGDVEITDFAETDMWHVWCMRNRVKHLRSRRIKTKIK